MKDSVTFDIGGADAAPGKVWRLTGYAGAPLPIDLLAQYVLDVHREMWNDLANAREPRAVPTRFDVTYDDRFVTRYDVIEVLRDNQKYDCVGLAIID